MKNSKIYYLLFAVLIAFAGCKKEKSFCEKSADGYIFTVNKEFYDRLPDDARDYGVTFMDLTETSKVDSTILRRIFSDKSKYSTLEGTLKKLGDNRFEIITGQKLLVDPMKLHFGILWGVDSPKLSKLIEGGFGACKAGSCGVCHGICDMLDCACETPNCQYACCGC